MARRIAQLYRLLSAAARAQLVVITVLLVAERIVLAVGAIGITRQSAVIWIASGGVVALWGVRGLLRQRVVKEAREKLTMAIAEGALTSRTDGSFLPGEEADAAIFDGRFAAEQVIVRHLPSLLGEPLAAIALLAILRPVGVPILFAAAAVAGSAVLLSLLRNMTAERQKEAWRKYMTVARDTMTSIRAATELVASGHEQTYLERLRASVRDWTETAARAERNAALFQRIPFAAIAVLGLVLLLNAQTLDLDTLIRLGVLFPPVAGVIHAAFDLARTAPRIHTLGAALDASSKQLTAGKGRPPPDMPCEIHFEAVSFAYDGVPVLKDVSFVWKPGQVLGLRGPNGSGKSTLLKLILGLLEPTTGRILVGGVDLREIDLPAWRRGIAYLPQRCYLPEDCTVLEAMQLIVPEITEEEARAALQLTDTWEQLDLRTQGGGAGPLQTLVATRSAGVRQRIMLARTMGRPTALAILDEPDENLDSKTREALAQLARKRGGGQGVIVATHDQVLLAITDVVINLAEVRGAREKG